MSPEKLFLALENGDVDEVIRMLDQNPRLANAANENGQSTLWIAACLGYKSVVEHMLKEPIRSILDYRTTDRWLRNAIDAAEAFKHFDIVEILQPLFANNTVALEHERQQAVAPSLQELWSQIKHELLKVVDKGFSTNKFALAGFFAIIAIAAAVFSVNAWFQSNRIDRIVARGSDEQSIEEAVRVALSTSRHRQENSSVLQHEIQQDGWESVAVTRDQATIEIVSGDGTFVTCIIELKNENETQRGIISVKSEGKKILEVSSNVSSLRLVRKSTKDALTAYAINVCFN